jgi:hypothetical protein
MKVLAFLNNRVIGGVLLLYIVALSTGCKNTQNSNDSKIKELQDRVEILEYKLHIAISDSDKVKTYTAFQVGENGFKIVNDHFKLTLDSVVYQTNGYKVKGTIGNLTSFNISLVRIEGAIRDFTVAGKLVEGDTEVNALYSGVNERFEIFIPTSIPNVKTIGLKVTSWRM